MVAKTKSTSEKDEKRGKVKVGKLKATRELSAEEAREVKGGKGNPGDFNFVHKVDKASPILS